MAQHSTVLTRERYVARYEEHGDGDLGPADFDLIAGQGADHVSRNRLLALRTEIEAAGEVVMRYVDERIAHEQRETEASLKFGQLKSAIHKLSALYTAVGHILTGAHHEPVPTIIDDWQAPFREGLFPLSDDPSTFGQPGVLGPPSTQRQPPTVAGRLHFVCTSVLSGGSGRHLSR